jgi:hypothetical protein
METISPTSSLGSVTDRMRLVREELDIQAREPIARDQRIGSFCVALANLVDEGHEVESLLQRTLINRPAMNPNHLINHALRVFQMPQLNNLKFFEECIEPQVWQNYIEDVFEQGGENYDRIRLYMRDANIRISSNIPNRYKGSKALLYMLRDRFDDNPSQLDVGASLNYGLKKIALSSMGLDAGLTGVSFGETAVLRRNRATDELEPDEVAEDNFNHALAWRFKPGLMLGIDSALYNDAELEIWADSCRYYPSERLNADQRREEEELLEESSPHGVYLKRVDFSDPTEHLEEYEDEKFDMVSFVTVLNQHDQETAQYMLSRARKYLKPNGVVQVTDFMRPNSFRFYKRWNQPWRYRTIVYDAMQNFKRQDMFVFDSGRPKQVQLCAGKLALNGKLWTPDQLLASRS